MRLQNLLVWCEVLMNQTKALAKQEVVQQNKIQTTVERVYPWNTAWADQDCIKTMTPNLSRRMAIIILNSASLKPSFRIAAFCVGIVCCNLNSLVFLPSQKVIATTLTPLPKNEVPHCPMPLLACATSQQAQNPPVPPPKPPIPPQNLEPNPNQDRFLQPLPTPAPIAPSTPSVQPSPTPTPQTTPPDNSQAFPVQKITVTGTTIFSPEQIQKIVGSYEGRTLTLEQLQEAADAITQAYLNLGYITSRAILTSQSVNNGVVEIRVLEGSLEKIDIENPGGRVNQSYIRSRIQLGTKTPLNTAQLEDQLRLLRADPLFANVEASLRAGTGLGKSILIVRVKENNPFEGSASIDNYSPPSVGSERLGINALYRNVTGYGDAIAGSFYHTTQSGADNLDLSYRLPVNPMNGALQLRTSLSWNKIVNVEPQIRSLDIQGDSQLYEISFQQPLIRSPREEFSLSLGFAYQQSQSISIFGRNLVLSPGANAEGVTRTSVIKFGQDYLRRDLRGAWSLRSLFSFGTGLFDATVNSPPLPDGKFFSWLGQVQRVQILGDNNFLIMGADVQLTPNRLLPSQQFVIGGGQSLRGYRQNIRAGDNGIRFSLEDRIALERNEAGNPIFQIAPFFDAGLIWNNDSRNYPLPPEQFLAGVGLGIIWEPVPKLNIRLDYGYPLIKIKDRGNNAQDEGFYFNVRYQF
jgi:hemolysin activation/secretion protein